MDWHQSKVDANSIFNFKEEFIAYCRNDVKILLSAIMSFRKLFQSVAQLDPTTRNFTLAAVGQETYRTLPMIKPIGIVPATGYLQTRNSSIGENLWLDWLQTQLKTEVLRQQKVGPYFCDGQVNETVYEFNGCFYHGCPTCHPTNRNEPIYHAETNKHVTFNYLYKCYEDKKQYYCSQRI